MELGTYAPPPPPSQGDRFMAKEAVDRPLVVQVREHRTGIKTKFQPDGADGVVVDVADVRTNEVWIDVLWMNGAVVDGLAPYITQAVPIRLQWQAPVKGGGNSYIAVTPLDGEDLSLAQRWAQANPTRFDTERARRATDTNTQQGGAAAAAPAQPSTPAPAPQQQVPGETLQRAAAEVASSDNPQVQALLAQLQAQQQQPKAS